MSAIQTLIASAVATLALAANGAAAAPPEAELIVVVDHEQFLVQGNQSQAWAAGRLDAIAGLFAGSSPFSIVLVDTIVFSAGDPYVVTPDGNGEVDPFELLAALQAWVGGQSLPPHDAVILLSGHDFVGSATHAAFTPGACTANSRSAVVQASFTLDFDGALGAHALGHLLGACHDPPASRSPTCLDLGTVPGLDPQSCAGNFIMTGTLNPANPADTFSACSRADFDAGSTAESRPASRRAFSATASSRKTGTGGFRRPRASNADALVDGEQAMSRQLSDH